MATALGCIADDFTGATDLAGLLVRGGARTTLRLGVPDGPADGGAPVEVIALKIRSIPPEEAVEQARKALRWLRASGATRLYWKYCSTFDSTAEGNIGPVADALMGALGAAQTVHCPAFPENGRTVYMGNLFVGDQPLNESPMKDHPLTPMRDSDLTRLLDPQVTGGVGLVARPVVAEGAQAIQRQLARLAEEGTAHIIADAIDDADLAAIAAACRGMELLCGGSALAAPLPGLLAQDGLIDADAAALPPIPALAPGAIVPVGKLLCGDTRPGGGVFEKRRAESEAQPAGSRRARHGRSGGVAAIAGSRRRPDAACQRRPRGGCRGAGETRD